MLGACQALQELEAGDMTYKIVLLNSVATMLEQNAQLLATRTRPHLCNDLRHEAVIQSQQQLGVYIEQQQMADH